MTILTAQILTTPVQAWMKSTLGTMALISLVSGQPATLTNAPTMEPSAVVTSEETTLLDGPTVQEVLLHVCEERGYGEDCAKTLLGMLWTESSNRSTVIGDNGRARGYFQIHYRLHNITSDCAEDLVCSSNWTISYLERNQYPKYVNYAIQCHNSCNVENGYVGKVKRYAAQFWNEPLAVEQAAPIQLASN